MGRFRRKHWQWKCVSRSLFASMLLALCQCAFSPPSDLIGKLAKGREQPATSPALIASPDRESFLLPDAVVAWTEHSTQQQHLFRAGKSGTGAECFRGTGSYMPFFHGANFTMLGLERGILLVQEDGMARYQLVIQSIYVKRHDSEQKIEITLTDLELWDGAGAHKLFEWKFNHNKNAPTAILGPGNCAKMTYEIAQVFPPYDEGVTVPIVSFDSPTVAGEATLGFDGRSLNDPKLTKGDFKSIVPGDALRVTKVLAGREWGEKRQWPSILSIAGVKEGPAITNMTNVRQQVVIAPGLNKLRLDFVADCPFGLKGADLITVKVGSYVEFDSISELALEFAVAVPILRSRVD